MQKNENNYRRGGFYLICASFIALLIAWFFQAPEMALASIAIFGFGGAFVLILMGNRNQP